jgi:hypothetical protein
VSDADVTLEDVFLRRRRRREAEQGSRGSEGVVTRFFRRTKAVAHKEVLHIIRDARAVYMALGAPRS